MVREIHWWQHRPEYSKRLSKPTADLVCANCLTSWDMQHVQENKEEFKTYKGLVKQCPSCKIGDNDESS